MRRLKAGDVTVTTHRVTDKRSSIATIRTHNLRDGQFYYFVLLFPIFFSFLSCAVCWGLSPNSHLGAGWQNSADPALPTILLCCLILTVEQDSSSRVVVSFSLLLGSLSLLDFFAVLFSG
jgi:hypothetical protein